MKTNNEVSRDQAISSLSYLLAAIILKIPEGEERTLALKTALDVIVVSTYSIESKQSLAVVLAESEGKKAH